jgi:hypothetical protein
MKKPEVMDRRAYGVLSAPSGGVMIVIGHYRPAFLVSASEVQREEVRLREERDRAEQAELAARQQPTPSARRPSKQPETRPNKQSEMRCLRLNRRRPATPATRHGRQQRKSGGVATKPEARRIAANIAKLPDLRKRPQY